MRPVRPLLVLALLSFTALSGCFGSAEAVYIPRSQLPPDWEHTIDNDTQEVAGGNVDIIINRYARDGETSGQINLLGVTDVPFVNEHEHIREQIEKQTAAAGVTLTKVGAFDLVLTNGKSVKGVEYDVSKEVAWGSASGKAWRLEWDSGGFSGGAFGWATTESKTVLGTRTDTTTWEEVQDLMTTIDW